jgi:integrase
MIKNILFIEYKMNRIEIFKRINENKPELSATSAKVYTTTLAIVGLALGWSNIGYFTTKYKDVMAYLKTLPIVRAKAVTSALIALIKDKKVSKIYKEFILDVSAKVREAEKKQTKSAAQEQNWESWADIMKTYEQMKKEAFPLFEKESPTSANIKAMRDFVILSLYVLIPPRRIKDFTDLKISDIDKKKHNYWDEDKHQLVFNSYKTAKNYGEQRVDIPAELEEIFEKWIPIATEFSEYMIFNGYGEPMNQPTLTKTINNIFGKKISASMLRHIYISDVVLKDQPKITELEKMAHDMGQSTAQQQLYKKFD